MPPLPRDPAASLPQMALARPAVAHTAATHPITAPTTAAPTAAAHPAVARSAVVPPRTPVGETMRLFVAIAPPAEVLDELDALAAPLRAVRSDLRWTSRNAWHVTLAFLGQVDEQALARLLPRLERAARRHHDIRLRFAGAGAFQTAERANVLWSGLSGDRRALANLAASVTAGASRAGAPPPDKRRFQPHLTLARCRLPTDVCGIVAALAGYEGQPWTADRIHLVRSNLRQDTSARYATVASWPLRGPEPPVSVTRTG
jgi:RNA 2',3'-cyclic 3'-phosphodiesterase